MMRKKSKNIEYRSSTKMEKSTTVAENQEKSEFVKRPGGDLPIANPTTSTTLIPSIKTSNTMAHIHVEREAAENSSRSDVSGQDQNVERIIVISKNANLGVITSVILTCFCVISFGTILICATKKSCKQNQEHEQISKEVIEMKHQLKLCSQEVNYNTRIQNEKPNISSCQCFSSSQDVNNNMRNISMPERYNSKELCRHDEISPHSEVTKLEHNHENDPSLPPRTTENFHKDGETCGTGHELRKTNQSEPRYHSKDAARSEATTSINSNTVSNVNIENLIIAPIQTRRKRLLSLQTSFESVSESCTFSASNCKVFEIENLGNGIVKKTVYLYEIDDIDSNPVDDSL